MDVINTVHKHLFSYLPICSGDESEKETTSKLAYYYIPFRLRTKLDQSLLEGLPREFLIPPQNPTELQQIMGKLCLELEDTNEQFFEHLSRTLTVTNQNVRATFIAVCKEIIVTGINWGRVVSIFVFAGVLCHHFILHKQPQVVVEVTAVLCEFIDEHIMPWINQNGGWVSGYFYVY